MNRRKALIGIGSLAVGSGAALGSGAFTSVSADRSVNVSVAGDGNAFLSLSPGSNSGSFAENTDGTIQINLNGTSNGNAEGLNFSAVTTIDSIISVTNTGSSSVNLHVSAQSGDNTTVDTSKSPSVLSVPVKDDGTDAGSLYLKFFDPDGNSIVDTDGTNNSMSIGADLSKSITLEIDTTDVTTASSTTNYSYKIDGITFNANDPNA